MLSLANNRIGRKLLSQLDKRDRNEVPHFIVFFVLLAGTLVILLNQTSIKTALPQIISSLGISPTLGQWIVSTFTLIKGIMVPISAYCMTKFRTRNLFSLMLLIFALGSFFSAVGSHFVIVLVGSVLQGIAAGIVIPLGQTVILTIIPPANRGAAMGMMSVVIGLGPTFGPSLGGWIVDLFSWNFLYFLWGALALAVIPIANLVIGDILPYSNPNLDLKAVLDSLFGFGLLLYGLSVLASNGFHSFIGWTSIIIGVTLIMHFIYRNLKSLDPLLNIRVFKNRNYLVGVIVATVGLITLTGVANIMPMYVQSVLGKSATLSGLVLLPGGVVKQIISPIAGKIYDQTGIGMLGKLGTLFIFLGPLLLIGVSLDTSLWLVMLSHIILSLGFGLMNSPTTTEAMNDLEKEDLGHGTSARQTVRQIGASFIVTLSFASMTLFSNLFSSTTTSEINIWGIQAAFIVVTLFAFTGFIFSFFFKSKK